ncbi:hypothetical protein CFN78_18685 [Amycolatopsis antarctica]|uniref:Uncharacterized protein n=2 Tax=Amycolatopsis antarctica TaxID=1854586 RepID=A0A263CZG9_9PSEU|nr:hypothetical protein CFN78_18685 [Amycolatopsis antarctica]
MGRVRYSRVLLTLVTLVVALTGISAAYWPAYDAGPSIASPQRQALESAPADTLDDSGSGFRAGRWTGAESGTDTAPARRAGEAGHAPVHRGSSPLYLGTAIHHGVAGSFSAQQHAALPVFAAAPCPRGPAAQPPSSAAVRVPAGEPARISPQRGPPHNG